jgi:hypothetical protein
MLLVGRVACTLQLCADVDGLCGALLEHMVMPDYGEELNNVMIY